MNNINCGNLGLALKTRSSSYRRALSNFTPMMVPFPLAVLGFSLIELLVVLTIVSTLTTLTLPTYLRYLEKSAMVAAQSEIHEIVQMLEREFTLHGGYSNNEFLVTSSLANDTGENRSRGGYRYEISADTHTYKITAYSSDPNPSFVLSLDHEGRQTHSIDGGVMFIEGWP